MDRCGGIDILLVSNIHGLPQTFTQLFFILSLFLSFFLSPSLSFFLSFPELLAFTATLLIRGLNKGDAMLYNVKCISILYLLTFLSYRQVIEGARVLDILEAQETFNERPKSPCVIVDCGVFNVEALWSTSR